MRALLCLALISAFASTALAATPISRGAGMDLKNDIEGQYRLENGRNVRLVQVDHKLYLDLNRYYRKELHPVADKVLASRDGRLTVQYMPEGRTSRILIQHPELPADLRLGERSWRGR